jgi:hypothetical protein
LEEHQARKVKWHGKRKAKGGGKEKRQKGGKRRQAKTDDRPPAEIDPNGAGETSGKSSAEPARTLAKRSQHGDKGGHLVDAELSYEIFKKHADNTTVLVEAVKGIEEAQKRIKELNSESTSEEYFVFDPLKASVIEPTEPAIAIDPFAP